MAKCGYLNTTAAQRLVQWFKTLHSTFGIKWFNERFQRPEAAHIDFKCSTIIYRDRQIAQRIFTTSVHKLLRVY